jgi:hypothetical protein
MNSGDLARVTLDLVVGHQGGVGARRQASECISTIVELVTGVSTDPPHVQCVTASLSLTPQPTHPMASVTRHEIGLALLPAMHQIHSTQTVAQHLNLTRVILKNHEDGVQLGMQRRRPLAQEPTTRLGAQEP